MPQPVPATGHRRETDPIENPSLNPAQAGGSAEAISSSPHSNSRRVSFAAAR
jgi:hypothetical protein